MFWNHSKQHSSKTDNHLSQYNVCFGTIRNNTALKRLIAIMKSDFCFGTIRNNTALKLVARFVEYAICFGTIRNNTALKLHTGLLVIFVVLEPFETTQL